MNYSLIMHSFSSENKIKINVSELEKAAEKISECLNIEIKHLAFCIEKNSKPSSKFLRYTEKNKLKIRNAASNDECIDNVEFYSLNTSDFEPDSKLVIDFNFEENFLKKINCVIDLSLLSENIFSKYIEINNIFINTFNILSGYAFYFPNNFFPLSFSNSIFRKMNMPIDYKNISNWIYKSKKLLGFLGNYNYIYVSDTALKNKIISSLDQNDDYFEQDKYLFWNMSKDNSDISDLIHSDRYESLSGILVDNDILDNNIYKDFL